MRDRLKIEPMSAARWHLFRVRPQNHPVRRIVGMAHLVARFIEIGLVKGLLSLVVEGKPAALAHGLSVPPFIGRGRADEIAVNVVLPFFYAWAQISRDPSLRRTCLEIYARYPRMADNQITREMKRLLYPDARIRVVTTARRHQGFIHLYKAINVRLESIALPTDVKGGRSLLSWSPSAGQTSSRLSTPDPDWSGGSELKMREVKVCLWERVWS